MKETDNQEEILEMQGTLLRSVIANLNTSRRLNLHSVALYLSDLDATIIANALAYTINTPMLEKSEMDDASRAEAVERIKRRLEANGK